MIINLPDTDTRVIARQLVTLREKGGIVTTGRIGQCMARICKGYGMTVLAWDAYPNKAL